MIQITDKYNCCGCAACVQICPKQCISFNEDGRGFCYPLVNKDLCIDCGLCEKVCPCLCQSETRKPLKVYAAINPDEEIRMKSSSGGIFTILAEHVIDEGGVVFGACFDQNWDVIHDYTETKEGLDAFRGSKYVQSRIGDTYKLAHKFLKAGRKVLYSATPCQIAGLKKFLRQEYDNLITIDVVCHGVPSPKVWRDYLNSLCMEYSIRKNTVLPSLKDVPCIKGISFRNKKTGWKKFSFVAYGATERSEVKNSVLSASEPITSEYAWKNLYMKAFLNNLILRPSCFSCPAKSGKSHSDFSIADFWAIKQYIPQLDDDKGTTLLYAHTDSALQILSNLKFNSVELDSNKELNSAFTCSAKEKYPIDEFWERYSQKGLIAINEVCRQITPSPIVKFYRRVISFIKRKMS